MNRSIALPLALWHNETTTCWLITVTALFHRLANQFRDQRPGETADFRVARHHFGKRTTETLNKVRAITLSKFSQASEFVQNADCHLQARLQITMGRFLLLSHTPPCSPHQRLDLIRIHLLTKYLQQLS